MTNVHFFTETVIKIQVSFFSVADYLTSAGPYGSDSLKFLALSKVTDAIA
jgi:hypothetical protein